MKYTDKINTCTINRFIQHVIERMFLKIKIIRLEQFIESIKLCES